MKPFNFIHGQTLWKGNIISVLLFEAKSLLIGLQIVLMAAELLFDMNLSIYFSI